MRWFYEEPFTDLKQKTFGQDRHEGCGRVEARRD